MDKTEPKHIFNKQDENVLSYVLYRMDNFLIFQVKYQDERFIGDRYYHARNFTAKNGVTIVSRHSPHLWKTDVNRIYIRGGLKDRDNEVTLLELASDVQAEHWERKYNEAFEDFAFAPEFVGDSVYLSKEWQKSKSVRDKTMWYHKT